MSDSPVVIVDYGLGNLLSVSRAVESLGAGVKISADPRDIVGAERLILPGVGAFADGMAKLRSRELDAAVKTFASKERPLLGVCLGMQMLADQSEEFGATTGLSLIPGRVRKIPMTGAGGKSHKIPHIGWNRIAPPAGRSWAASLLAETPAETAWVYFVHSYAFEPANEKDLLALADYNGLSLTATVQRGNTMGCQFHPEKSGPVGLGILKSFLKL